MRQNRSPSLLVQITSFKCTFIHVSQLTRWPLYVSPFLSSTSCDSVVERNEKKNLSVCQQAPRREKSQIFVDVGRSIRARSTRVSGGARAVSRHPRVRETRERVFARRNCRLDVPSGGLGTSSAARGAASRAVVVLDCGTRAITLRRVNLSPTTEVSRRGKQGLRVRSSGSVSENDRGRWVCVTDLPGAVACGDARAAARVRPANRISRKGPKTRSPVTRHQCLHRRVFINFAPAGF